MHSVSPRGLLIFSYYRCLPDHYDGLLYRAHCEVLYTTLLIHLDDSSEQMQVIEYKNLVCFVTFQLQPTCFLSVISSKAGCITHAHTHMN